MNTTQASHGSGDGMPEPKERRRHPRLYYPMPLTVRVGGLEYEAVVRDLSAGGVCSCLPTKIRTGDSLGLAIEFLFVGRRPAVAPRLSAEGIVTRVRDLEDGTFEFAARFTSHRLV